LFFYTDAKLAGIKDGDYVIEVNGHNIETFNHEQVVELIRAVKYPEQLQMLVLDAPTYMSYKQQSKLIHHGLPNVKTPAHSTSLP
jgi:hypothetical protein